MPRDAKTPLTDPDLDNLTYIAQSANTAPVAGYAIEQQLAQRREELCRAIGSVWTKVEKLTGDHLSMLLRHGGIPSISYLTERQWNGLRRAAQERGVDTSSMTYPFADGMPQRIPPHICLYDGGKNVGWTETILPGRISNGLAWALGHHAETSAPLTKQRRMPREEFEDCLTMGQRIVEIAAARSGRSLPAAIPAAAAAAETGPVPIISPQATLGVRRGLHQLGHRVRTLLSRSAPGATLGSAEAGR